MRLRWPLAPGGRAARRTHHPAHVHTHTTRSLTPRTRCSTVSGNSTSSVPNAHIALLTSCALYRDTSNSVSRQARRVSSAVCWLSPSAAGVGAGVGWGWGWEEESRGRESEEEQGAGGCCEHASHSPRASASAGRAACRPSAAAPRELTCNAPQKVAEAPRREGVNDLLRSRDQQGVRRVSQQRGAVLCTRRRGSGASAWAGRARGGHDAAGACRQKACQTHLETRGAWRGAPASACRWRR